MSRIIKYRALREGIDREREREGDRGKEKGREE